MVLGIFGGLLLAAALLQLVPALVLLVQVIAARGARDAIEAEARRPSLAILMPAHDEAAGIADAIRALSPQLLVGDRLLVVADNCSDSTAAVAAEPEAKARPISAPSSEARHVSSAWRVGLPVREYS